MWELRTRWPSLTLAGGLRLPDLPPVDIRAVASYATVWVLRAGWPSLTLAGVRSPGPPFLGLSLTHTGGFRSLASPFLKPSLMLAREFRPPDAHQRGPRLPCLGLSLMLAGRLHSPDPPAGGLCQPGHPVFGA